MPTRRVFLGQLISAAVAARAAPVAQTDPPQEISGVYPTLAMFAVDRALAAARRAVDWRQAIISRIRRCRRHCSSARKSRRVSLEGLRKAGMPIE
jgi:hypothetical protein